MGEFLGELGFDLGQLLRREGVEVDWVEGGGWLAGGS